MPPKRVRKNAVRPGVKKNAATTGSAWNPVVGNLKTYFVQKGESVSHWTMTRMYDSAKIVVHKDLLVKNPVTPATGIDGPDMAADSVYGYNQFSSAVKYGYYINGWLPVRSVIEAAITKAFCNSTKTWTYKEDGDSLDIDLVGRRRIVTWSAVVQLIIRARNNKTGEELELSFAASFIDDQSSVVFSIFPASKF